jgi:hypothetical protein
MDSLVLPLSQNIATFRLFRSQTFSTLTLNSEIIIKTYNIKMILVDLS